MVIAIVVVGGIGTSVYYLANHYLDAQALHTTSVVDCTQHGVSHQAVIRSDGVNPAHTYASLCDTLTILNTDNRIRLIAFGPHEHHVPYDGVTEQVLAPGQHLTIVLDQAGSFSFHDHIDDAVVGSFTVSSR